MKTSDGEIIQVLVADSHVTVRLALRRLLAEEPDLCLAGEAVRGRDLLAEAQSLQPDVVLLEWELPGLPPAGDGCAVVSQPLRTLFYQLHASAPHLQVVVLSGWPQAQTAALLAGADAFVSTGSPPQVLLSTLRTLSRQRSVRAGLHNGGPSDSDFKPEPEVSMNIRNYRKVKAEQQEPGITLRWLISELEEAPSVALKLYELAPGVVGPVHTHVWEDEVFVLRGRGAVVGPEGEVAIGEGDVLYIPPRERHQFVNKGDDDLCLLMAVPKSEQMTLAAVAGM
jgi:DNA-binding NarL/FixJ family response regulator